MIVTAEGRYAIVQAEFPGSNGAIPVGVLLQDLATDRLYVRLRRDFDVIAGDEAEILEALEDDLQVKAVEMGAERLFLWLEETLSNTVQVSNRQAILVDDFDRLLNRLYARHVHATVRVGLTHVPRWSVCVAAGRFLDNAQVEPEGYEEVSPRVGRLTTDLFAVGIIGTSMEPLIPNGSVCLFRRFGGGSREGKLVLVEELGRGENDRYTVKRYTAARNRLSDGGWEHSRIRLEPLNPAHEGWDLAEDPDRYRIIAEFVEVLY